MTIAASSGIFRVYTGGGVIVDDHSHPDSNGDYNFIVPQGMELTCSINGTADIKDNDFRIAGGLKYAMVLDLRDTIELSQDNASFSDCNLLAGNTGGGPEGDTANPYSPAYWYPDCDPITGSCTGNTPHLRSAIFEYSAFNPNPTAAYHTSCASVAFPTGCGPASNSVGISITGSKDAVRNVTVMGFGKCYSTSGGGKAMIIDNLTGDCDGGLSIVSSSDATQINGVLIKAFLTNGNGSASLAMLKVRTLEKDAPSGKYAATVQLPADPDFAFEQHDTVWIATSPYDAGGTVHGTGAESAAGRWTVGNDPGSPALCSGTGTGMCQTLILDAPAAGEPDSRYSDATSKLTILAVTLNSTVGGVPPTALTGISTVPLSADQQTLQLVAVGQTVDDGGVCIPEGAIVTAVWPAQGIVYISMPVLSTCTPNTSENVSFYDAGFQAPEDVCDISPAPGCAAVSANERFGDGVFIQDSGGVSAVNCQIYEHLVAYHFFTNANSSRFTNCSTGENVWLPDNDIIGLKIDGSHDPNAGGDACGNDFVNSVLGQHRTVGILVQSNCTTPNHISNVGVTTHTGGRRNAIGLEVDAGSVLLSTSHAVGIEDVFKADQATLYDGSTAEGQYPASLSISSNSFLQATLYMSNSVAAASTSGCGNRFLAPTPYLCAPSSFTQLPGGRLALASGSSSDCNSPVPPPVMGADAIHAGCVFYVPYVSQQVPIYNPASGVFGLTDIGPTGLKIRLNNVNHTSGNVYDVFVEPFGDNGSAELCTFAWTNSMARAAGVVQVNGVWVNGSDLHCRYNNSSTDYRDCLPQSCTYAGSFYATADAETEQQFGPISGSGGGAPCLCLYNAYNHVTLTSASADSSAAYSYSSATWRFLNSSANNSVTVLDGLQQMQIAGLLNDALANAGGVGTTNRTAAMGVEALALPGSAAAPPLVVQANSASKGSYSATLSAPPLLGLWAAYAVESANSGSSGSPNFGGPGFQQLSVQVAD